MTTTTLTPEQIEAIRKSDAEVQARLDRFAAAYNANVKANLGKLRHGDDMPFKGGIHQGEMNRCAVCERKTGNDPLYVEVFDGGAIWDVSTHGEADINDRGYMGHYPVGSECAKKFATGVLKGVAA